MTEMKVHPVADLFPMMSEDELADLAEDIRINGLIHPIIVIEHDDGSQTLIDGRNRLRACELAGIEPEKQLLNGQDPVAYILSSNDRRDMTQGQRAVVAAMANTFTNCKFGDLGQLARALKVPLPRVSEAIIIAKHAPDLAERVRKGDAPFQPALEKARQIKAETEIDDNKMARLREEAPDLADLAGISLDQAIAKLNERNVDAAKLKTIEQEAPELVRKVTEGHLTVSQAMAVFAKEQEDARARQQGATSRLFQIVHLIDVGVGNYKDAAARLMEDVTPKMWPADRIDDLTAAHLKTCGDFLAECAKHLKQRKGD